ncbi:dynamin family protein [Geodermatophilus sp. SYSU D01180]
MSDPAVASARLAFTRAIGTVRAAVAAVDERLSRAVDEAEAAARAVERAVVVVVGEVKQGKSSLVNALVGRPGTSPTDVTVTTATYLVFQAGERPGATLHLADGAPPVQVDVADLGAWVTPDAAAPVRYAEVVVEAPWLDDLVLVDTPGAGGLAATHATAALEAAGRASALLFVTDAFAPLSRVELDFLRQAAAHVETVVFALTKIGPRPGWSEVLAENRANLAAVAPRFTSARWVPVDSLLAARALDDLGAHPTEVAGAMDDQGVTDALEDWEESGVGELLGVLRTELAPATEALAAANALRAARSIAERADRELVLRLAQLQADPALEEAVAEYQRRLVELDDEQRTWAPRLERELAELRIDLSRQLATRVDEERDRWTERLRTLRRAPDDATFAQLCDQLQQDLDVVAREALESTCRRFRVIADHLFEELSAPESVVTALDGPGAPLLLPPPKSLPPDRSHGIKDVLDLYFGWLMGTGLATGAGSALGWVTGLSLGPIGWALGAVGGIAGIALRSFVNRDSGRQADVRSAVLTWITQAEVAIRSEVERNSIQARFHLAEAFRTALQQARSEAQEFLDASKAARQRSAAESATRRQALDGQRRALAKAVERVDGLLATPLAVEPGWRTKPGG